MEKNRLLKKAIISFEEYERLVKDGVQKDILEQRIDRAVKYIEEEMFMYDNIEAEREDLLKLLKGKQIDDKNHIFDLMEG